jgi:rhodanese-related sulfurtransferase
VPLTKEEVLEKMKDPAVVLVNVLSEKEFDHLHITNSQSMALGPNVRAFESAALKKFGKQTFLITYGADKDSSLGLNAAKILAGKGFKADNYPGGLKDWSEAGWPTEPTPHSARKLAPPHFKKKGKVGRPHQKLKPKNPVHPNIPQPKAEGKIPSLFTKKKTHPLKENGPL